MNLEKKGNGVYFHNNTLDKYTEALGMLINLHNRLRSNWLKTEIPVDYLSFYEDLLSNPTPCINDVLEKEISLQSKDNKYVERIVRQEILKDAEPFLEMLESEVRVFKSDCSGFINKSVLSPNKYLNSKSIYFNEDNQGFEIKEEIFDQIESDCFVKLDPKQLKQLDKLTAAINEVFEVIINNDGLPFFEQEVYSKDFNVLQYLFNISQNKCIPNERLVMRIANKIKDTGTIKFN